MTDVPFSAVGSTPPWIAQLAEPPARLVPKIVTHPFAAIIGPKPAPSEMPETVVVAEHSASTTPVNWRIGAKLLFVSVKLQQAVPCTG